METTQYELSSNSVYYNRLTKIHTLLWEILIVKRCHGRTGRLREAKCHGGINYCNWQLIISKHSGWKKMEDIEEMNQRIFLY